MKKSIKLLIFLSLSGCAICPMRVFDIQEKTCFQCHRDYIEWDGYNKHQCKREQ